MKYFWAKINRERDPGISVYDHMVNVGCVARCMAENFPNLLERFKLRSSTIGALAALHDLGKISPGFQRKCEAWLEENGLTTIARNGCWDTAMESNHGKVSHASIQSFLLKMNIDQNTAKYVSAVLGGHHGRLNPPNDRGYRPQKLICDSKSGIDWDAERMRNAQMIWDCFVKEADSFVLADDDPALWWVAGLTSVADWIGSDERFFSPEREKGKATSIPLVKEALGTIGFQKIEFVRNLSFHDLFHGADKPKIQWEPNEMQEKALESVTGAGVYVIEAPMGMGKTEAALWAAYQLLVQGKAAGIYFALPTQATSNRMHLRMNEFIRRICPEFKATRLIHSNSWLTPQGLEFLPVATSHDSALDDARMGRDWFNSAKRALIAPFGVGTIDQALLGVVAAKHFFVRHFALAGKVVILDEIHSYDLYTGTLIDKLVTTLEALGCTVIILSATLSGKRRVEILSLKNNEEDESQPYPLITGRHEGQMLDPVSAEQPKPQVVKVDFCVEDTLMEDAVKVACAGGAVLWICNTIERAQNQYQRFVKVKGQDKFPTGLLHSRFPYWRREALENEWMERFGKDGKTRCGSILVSTQVVEQSVDLDADLLVTELAPTDMLLQRLGRLWRHERQNRPVDTARFCILKEEKTLEDFRGMDSKEIVEVLGGKAHVYDPFILLRTLQVWLNYPEIIVPTQIRELIEATYRNRDDDPESWSKLFDDRFVRNCNDRFKAAMNGNYWQPQLPDAEGVQTRLNDVLTVSVILCRNLNKTEAVFIDRTSEKLDSDKFKLSTAQAIHRNLVRVPEHCFEKENIKACSAFKDYVFGKQNSGIVTDDGAVAISGLKSGIRLFYSDELGLVVKKLS